MLGGPVPPLETYERYHNFDKPVKKKLNVTRWEVKINGVKVRYQVNDIHDVLLRLSET